MNENLAFTIGNGDGFEEAVVSESSDIKTTSLEGELTKESSEMESMQETVKAVGDPEEGLPPAVTEAPQSPEHIDLRKVKPYQKWLNAYLDVSDDQGEFLRDNTLEADVKVLCDELDSLELGEGSDLNALIELVREILIRYASTVNLSENVSIGMITKYRIRQGMLLRHQKKLVTEGLGENWIEWFKKNYKKGLLRSYQDYMRIAGVQNAIKYAVFGKERLLGIIRQLQNTDGDDPIGDFLADNGVDFAVEVETDPEEVRVKADIAVNHQKLVSEDLGEIPLDKVKAFVESGNTITKKHINELTLVKKTGGDLNSYMDGLIASKGKAEPVMTPERKAESYKNALVSFLDKTKTAISDQEYISQIDLDLCKELKDQIEALEQEISSRQSS
jgi:hypothetical protein